MKVSISSVNHLCSGDVSRLAVEAEVTLNVAGSVLKNVGRHPDFSR